MNLVQENLETVVRHPVHFLGVQLFGEGGEARHVREEHGHKLALSLESTSSGQDLLGEKRRGVGVRLGVVDPFRTSQSNPASEGLRLFLKDLLIGQERDNRPSVGILDGAVSQMSG